MGILSDGEILAMRTEADTLLASTCVTQRGTFVADGHGGNVWSLVSSATIPCRLDVKPMAQEAAINGALNVVAHHTMYFKYDATIGEKDRIVFGGKTYEVSAVLENQSWIFAKRAELTRLK